MCLLILASQSPYRRMQLENFGLKFTAEKPDVDEDQLKRQGPPDLNELTRFLAEKKARSLSAKYPNDLIIGSDQLAELAGERLDKPGNAENAFAQLKKMSGQEHRLITSMALLKGGEIQLFTDVTRVRLRKLTDTMIERYLRVDQPFDCAGSYKIEKAGLGLVEALETRDPSAIQGMPMLSLMRGLEKWKMSVDHFWI